MGSVGPWSLMRLACSGLRAPIWLSFVSSNVMLCTTSIRISTLPLRFVLPWCVLPLLTLAASRSRAACDHVPLPCVPVSVTDHHMPALYRLYCLSPPLLSHTHAQDEEAAIAALLDEEVDTSDLLAAASGLPDLSEDVADAQADAAARGEPLPQSAVQEYLAALAAVDAAAGGVDDATVEQLLAAGGEEVTPASMELGEAPALPDVSEALGAEVRGRGAGQLSLESGVLSAVCGAG